MEDINYVAYRTVCLSYRIMVCLEKIAANVVNAAILTTKVQVLGTYQTHEVLSSSNAMRHLFVNISHKLWSHTYTAIDAGAS